MAVFVNKHFEDQYRKYGEDQDVLKCLFKREVMLEIDIDIIEAYQCKTRQQIDDGHFGDLASMQEYGAAGSI